MKKILILIDWYTPAYKAGGPISSIYNLTQFLEEEINFYIVTSNKDLNSKKGLQGIKTNTWQQINKSKVIYLDKDFQTKRMLKKIVNDINPDKIYLNGLFSLFFSILPCYLFKKKFEIIINPRGMFGSSALSKKKFKKLLFIKLANTISFYKNICWHISNEAELFELKNNMKVVSKHFIIPNLPKVLKYLNNKIIDNEQLRLISVCRINEIKNIHFVLELLKDINIKCHYKIIGFIEDDNYYQKLKRIVKLLPKNIKVDFTGHLKSNEIEIHYYSSDLFISSSLNENYGHSIVESLSSGLPVLISNNCPWTGLEESFAGFRIRLDKIEFKEKILFFYNLNQDDYKKFNLGARTYFNNYMSPDLHKNNYLNLLSS